MTGKDAFYACLRDAWAPRLRAHGFKGSGQRFRRVVGEVVHAIGVQNNKYGGSCCVNLGVHARMLPLGSGEPPADLSGIRVESCEFQWRLTPPGHTDYWWGYAQGVAAHLPLGMGGGRGATAVERAQHLIETYWTHGEPRFQQLATVEALARLIRLEDLEGEGPVSPVYRFTRARAALTMARLHAHLGDRQRARAFAAAGLRHLGAARGLRAALEALLA